MDGSAGEQTLIVTVFVASPLGPASCPACVLAESIGVLITTQLFSETMCLGRTASLLCMYYAVHYFQSITELFPSALCVY